MKIFLLSAASLLLVAAVMFIYTNPASNKPNADFESLKNEHSTLSDDPVIVAAGDISCPTLETGHGECTQGLTAKIIEAINPQVVLALGDLQYPAGTYDNFNNFFDKTWGSFKDKIRPAVGNHEYSDPSAKGYYDYFGSAAGDRDKGYYSFGIGNWHLISLNSNCREIGGCETGSPQYKWLENDLNQNRNQCILAYWHHPRFSSGLHGENESMDDIFSLLYRHQAELVLSGHDHTYERLAKVNPDGKQDPRGIRSFVVGTGGRNLYRFLNPSGISETRQNEEYGVLKLVLHQNSYSWEFVSIKAEGYRDSGNDSCH